MDADTNLASAVSRVDDAGLGRRLGVELGDLVVEVNGVKPRDILEWRRLVDADEISLVLDRAGTRVTASGERAPGEHLGISIENAVFDRVQTCDNHCEFCFIYQLPKGMRRSLYLKDDDYRLSFLFGNFTTLTRFTEADLERVVDERLSPLFVSIHRLDPHGRADMLRNPRGGTSLRWLASLIDAGIEVNGQIVLCPGVNDRDALDETLLGVLEQFPGLARLAVVPLGISKVNPEPRMRAMSPDEAVALVRQISCWREIFTTVLGRPLVYLADEVYLRAGIPLPSSDYYDVFGMLEDGVGMARAFVEEFTTGSAIVTTEASPNFFAEVDAVQPCAYTNPAGDTGLRAGRSVPVTITPSRPVGRAVVLTGECAVDVIEELLSEWKRAKASPTTVEVLPVVNEFFGGTTSVAGLLTGSDLARAMAASDDGDTLFLLPDSCLNDGVFLDGTNVGDLARAHRVEVVPARGHLLRRRLDDLCRAGR